MALAALALAAPGAAGRPECAVSAAPAAGLEPLRYLRVKTVVEPDPRTRAVAVRLFGPYGLARASAWGAAGEAEPRTTWVVWKDLGEAAGEYDVRLEVGRADGTSCRASARVIVGGEGGF